MCVCRTLSIQLTWCVCVCKVMNLGIINNSSKYSLVINCTLKWQSGKGIFLLWPYFFKLIILRVSRYLCVFNVPLRYWTHGTFWNLGACQNIIFVSFLDQASISNTILPRRKQSPAPTSPIFFVCCLYKYSKLI